LRGFFHIFYFHSKVIDPFPPLPGWKNGQIDVAVGKINRLASVAASGNLFEAESGTVKLCKLGRVLRKNRYVSNPRHGFSPFYFLFSCFIQAARNEENF